MRSGLVCTPLRAEWAALWGTTAGPAVRTGQGPRRRLPDASGPIAVAGVAGGLDPRLRPGDIVVADRIQRDGAVLDSPAGVLVYGALRRLGLPVRLGTIYSAERVVHGAGRAEQAARGGIAVDTESAFLAEQAPAEQTVAVRTIVDTPDRPLLRPGTLWRGVAGLRALRAAAPALDQWAAATGEREILLADRRGNHGPAAARALAAAADLVLVLGGQDNDSADARRTAEAAAGESVETHLVATAADVDLRWLAGAKRVAVTAGAAAPSPLLDDLVRALSGLGPTTVREVTVDEENIRINPPREVS
jgi:4-hydroxy-3-methylbut-2-enyl diphosphate reductase